MKALLIASFSLVYASSCIGQLSDFPTPKAPKIPKSVRGNFDRNSSLRVAILDSAIAMDNDANEVTFAIELTNLTKRNLLLYGFTTLFESTSNLDFYRDPENTAGMVPYLKDVKNTKRKNIYLGLVDDVICGRVVTIDSVLNKIQEAGDQLSRSSILLRAKSTIQVTYQVKLDPRLNPEPGLYKMMMMYYCGRNITNLVSVDTLEQTASRANAIVYQGFAESDFVPLIVKD